ncbi:hypothetical protein K504DRAFT_456110 [Pleomassaria siparia CBS 279.74]|uniref:Tim17-domain-containing protein n=1 Tax=Pleomassaria siparia CBS 279.74 TaxID=1314801 RepID=A0A6G1K597_9PLEO|nr:hypothetical protein K504DRAFT_456110 [Pleomassaria siparia CBS 279.74]
MAPTASTPASDTIDTTPPMEAKPHTPRILNSSRERLGMTFDKRFLLSMMTSFTCGFTLGNIHAGRLASLRYRAENAHRLPISTPGWYLYHKSKNYYKLRHGIPEGIRTGSWLTLWVGLFFVVEESLDVFRGTWKAGRTTDHFLGVDELDMKDMKRGLGKSRDALSSLVAGVTTGGAWSLWNGFGWSPTSARTMVTGAVVGLGFGLTQDVLMFVRRKAIGDVDEEEGWMYRGAKNRAKKRDEEEMRKAEGLAEE